MNKLISKKAYSLLLLVVSLLTFAQNVPPPPENPESGDIGAPTATSPIDSYTTLLFVVALFLIAFFAFKSRKKILN